MRWRQRKIPADPRCCFERRVSKFTSLILYFSDSFFRIP